MKFSQIILKVCALFIPFNVHAKDIIKFTDKPTKSEFTLETADNKLTEIPFNKTIQIKLQVKSSEKVKISFTNFDCQMPEHNHGMITKSKITPKSDNVWIIEGFKLHMRGSWEFDLRFEINGKETQFKVPYQYQ